MLKFDKLYNKLIQEVRVIKPREYPEEREPLKDNETIRVYHGFNYLEHAIQTLKYGLSGKERIGRNYSYENNNNPTGLFVSLNIETALYFGSYVIEFHSKVSDLEAPIWPGSGYTVQGQMAEYFSNEEDRENKRLKKREENLKSKYPGIKDSDRPELAETLFLNNENQALFTGELDPNSIKYIWVNMKPEHYRTLRNFKRMKVKDFKKMFEKEFKEFKTPQYGNKVDYRLFKPREKVNLDELVKRMNAHYGPKYQRDKDEIIEDIKKYLKKHQMLNYVWPNQLDEIWDQIINYESK